jgi:ATP-dependent helicase HrpB
MAGLALELIAWGSPDPSKLAFLDQPPSRTYAEALDLLEALGAIDRTGSSRTANGPSRIARGPSLAGPSLTATGRRMLDLPLHPRLGRMVADAEPEDRWLACVLAAVVDERDPFRSKQGESPPSDLALRVDTIANANNSSADGHPWADRRAMERLRHRANDLARRSGSATENKLNSPRSGAVLALAFPDRLAIRRGSPGRFQLRTGTTAYLAPTDSLASEGFLIAADLDGKRRDARIRLAAAIDADDVAKLFSAEVETKVSLQWAGDRLVERTERRLGGLGLDIAERRPEPGPEVARMLAARIRKLGFLALDPDGRLTAQLGRLAFSNLDGAFSNLDGAFGDQNQRQDPITDRYLMEHLEDWLGQQLLKAVALDEIDPIKALASFRAASSATRKGGQPPSRLELANGRTVKVAYPDGTPRIAVEAQDLYGVDRHPEIGGVRVVVEVLSPANRPIQITSDLPGFWRGSWAQVRKEMMARYPKHNWPINPGG